MQFIVKLVLDFKKEKLLDLIHRLLYNALYTYFSSASAFFSLPSQHPWYCFFHSHNRHRFRTFNSSSNHSFPFYMLCFTESFCFVSSVAAHYSLFPTWRINVDCSQLAHHFSLFIWYCSCYFIFFLSFVRSFFTAYILLLFLWLLLLFNFQLFVVVSGVGDGAGATIPSFTLELKYLCLCYTILLGGNVMGFIFIKRVPVCALSLSIKLFQYTQTHPCIQLNRLLNVNRSLLLSLFRILTHLRRIIHSFYICSWRQYWWRCCLDIHCYYDLKLDVIFYNIANTIPFGLSLLSVLFCRHNWHNWKIKTENREIENHLETERICVIGGWEYVLITLCNNVLIFISAIEYIYILDEITVLLVDCWWLWL